jgi:hypothetical protein
MVVVLTFGKEIEIQYVVLSYPPFSSSDWLDILFHIELDFKPYLIRAKYCGNKNNNENQNIPIASFNPRNHKSHRIKHTAKLSKKS